MFAPSKPRIKAVAERYPDVIRRLDGVFGERRTGIYIDWANVRNWAETLHWHFDLERLKELLDSFVIPTRYPRWYWGTLDHAPKSQATIDQARGLGFIVRTKNVKRIRIDIDVRGTPRNSAAVLKRVMCRQFVLLLPEIAIMDLNGHVHGLNTAGRVHIEDLKCNFDVEIGTDMLTDSTLNNVENFVLFSGDSDFADTVQQLLFAKKSVSVLSTRGRIARELNELQRKGLRIFEVQGLQEFVGWKRETGTMPQLRVHAKHNAKGPC